MLPQIDNDITVVNDITTLPSKTYKLNIDNEIVVPYTLDNKNIVTFKLENYHLLVIPRSPDCEVTFELQNGHLVLTSENESVLEKYSLQNNNVYFETEIYGDRIMGYVDGLQAIKQAIYHILSVERYAYLIYSDNYGVELQQYIGADFSYLETTIESTLREALTYDLRIKDVNVTEVTNNNDYANVKFIVYTIYGDLQLEVNISV